MNETRKEIIGLIEPYMEKELSEWCLIKTDWNEYFIFHEDMEVWKEDWVLTLDEWEKIEKKYWHYDITAVLKCIGYKWLTRLEDFEISYNLKNIVFEYEWKNVFIPNKPLNLYTEQEDKELLEILKNLIK